MPRPLRAPSLAVLLLTAAGGPAFLLAQPRLPRTVTDGAEDPLLAPKRLPGAVPSTVPADEDFAGAASGSLDWGDPKHIQFFRYQKYLTAHGLMGETKEGWAQQPKEQRRAKIVKAETFLREKYAHFIETSYLGLEDDRMLAAVWGPEMHKAIQTFHAAKSVGDPEQIKKARESVGGISRQVGNLAGIDLGKIFDGAEKKGDGLSALLNSETATKDYLAAEKKTDFLSALDSPEIKSHLATQKDFDKFLRDKGVPIDALPGLAAMYGVLTRAPKEQKEQLAHILPTVVRFLEDGKKIAMEEMRGALGFAVPGDYDEPKKVGITSAVKATDPLIVGKTLAHEFQHIYDMYTGRYYTIDSEMRGFKVASVYFEALKKVSPAKYEEMRGSNDDSTRAIVRDAETYAKALAEGQNEFHQAVAFGHGYSGWHEGVFMGRLPLREAINPITGAPRELDATRRLLADAKSEAASLEADQDRVRRQRDLKPSRELDRELERATKDLAVAREKVAVYDREATLKELRLRRMQSEASWLDGKTQGATAEAFDLHLAVDRSYVTP